MLHCEQQRFEVGVAHRFCLPVHRDAETAINYSATVSDQAARPIFLRLMLVIRSLLLMLVGRQPPKDQPIAVMAPRLRPMLTTITSMPPFFFQACKALQNASANY